MLAKMKPIVSQKHESHSEHPCWPTLTHSRHLRIHLQTLHACKEKNIPVTGTSITDASMPANILSIMLLGHPLPDHTYWPRLKVSCVSRVRCLKRPAHFSLLLVTKSKVVLGSANKKGLPYVACVCVPRTDLSPQT